MEKIIKVLKKLYWDLRGSNWRGRLLAIRYKNFPRRAIIKGNCKFRNLKLVSAKDGLVICDNVEICLNQADRSITPQLVIGKNVSIGRHTIIGCSNIIILEDDVRLAPHCHITDRNHRYDIIDTPIWRQPVVMPGPTIIKSQTWLGFGVQVMPGVTIGRHCVIAAGSVVTKDIPDYSVAAGAPAKVIKQYNSTTAKWEPISKK